MKRLILGETEAPHGPEGQRKLAGGASHRIIAKMQSAPAGAAEDSGTPSGVRPMDVLFRWLRSFLASPPANFRSPSGRGATFAHRWILSILDSCLFVSVRGLRIAAHAIFILTAGVLREADGESAVRMLVIS